MVDDAADNAKPQSAGAPAHPSDLSTPDPLAAALVPDPAAPSGFAILEGHFGTSAREGHVRLYLSPEMDEYLEIAEAHIVHRAPVPESCAEFGGSALWVRHGTPMDHVRFEAHTDRARDWAGDCPPDCPPSTAPAAAGDGEQAELPDLSGLCLLTGYLGRAARPEAVRLYLTAAFAEYLEIAHSDIRQRKVTSGEPAECGGTSLWVNADAPVSHVLFNSRPVKAGGDQGRDFHRPRSRPSWRDRIRRRYPVRPGEHRRHIVSYRWLREFSKHLDEEALRKLGFDPKDHGGVDGARRAWVEHHFNNPDNFWRGDGWVNSWLGRWMHWFEEFNWDAPSDEAAERERERREREEREERERREREEREREEREREERERREREERERERREREERERRERAERERQRREREERERRERERREREERERRERLQRERERERPRPR